MFSLNFEVAFDNTVGLEGGYSNHPKDRGGETYMGIARNFHPTWKGWAIIDSLKGSYDFPNNLRFNSILTNYVKDFYNVKYWLPLQLDALISQDIQNEIFDTGVNCGKRGTAFISQRAINFLGENVVVDGWFGPVTFGRINYWIKKDVRALFKALNGFQFIWYVDIVENNPDQRVFTRGWMKRIGDYKGL